MIALRNFRVTGFTKEYQDIYWEIAPTMEDVQEYTFTLERSEAEAGPFIPITGALTDRYYVRDNDVLLISTTRTYFYRVKLVHAMSGRTVYSEVADRAGKLDLIGAEVTRLETLVFKEHSGGTCWLFPRRTFGQRCPQCWDRDMEKVIDSNCPTCFKTGFSGGYHYPVQFHAQIDESEKADSVSMHDHHQQRIYSFRCPSSPELTPEDLFIDFKNRRMRVVKIGGTSRLGVGLRQEVTAVLLQPGSIEDAIPLNVDAKNLELTAHRNYTNPQNLEAVGVIPDDALSSLLGEYGY